MKPSLRVMAWLLGLVPLGLPPTAMTALAEGSKQLTPNTPATAALPLSDPANTRSGYLEHDGNFTGTGVSGANRAFLKPFNFTDNGRFTYSDDQRMYVLLKPGETVYYGLHRVPHAQGNAPVQQNDLLITARYSLDGKGAGTFGQRTKILRDSSNLTSTALRQSAFLTTLGGNPQAGVIASAAQAQAGPQVGGLPAAGYVPLSFTNTTGATQYVWFEFVQHGEVNSDGTYNTAFTDAQRFSVYDFWDFTVKTSGGVEKPGRLFSKQWGFSAGEVAGRFSATFNMYPLIPSPRETSPAKYFVKKFELAGLAPQNFFRFVTNSAGADPAKVTPNTFDFTTKSQETEVDYPEYFSFVNDPDPEVWPSAANPDLQVVSTASYCNGTGGGVMEFFLRSSLGGQVSVDIELNGVAGYQPGTSDRRITATIPAGNSRLEWNGLDGLNARVASGTPLTLVFKNGTSPIAPVNFPVWDAEDNLGGFRIQNVRPGFQGFDVLYWDDSNLNLTKFPDTPATPRTQLTGVPSSTGVHTWGGATGSATAIAGDGRLVNTFTYGETAQQTRSFTFLYVCDPDLDGVADNVDIDQDNDGIPNPVESGGVDPAFVTANGVPRYLDAFEANFVDINSDGINDVYDLDLDGRPNFLDIDADGDGIPDALEANGGVAPANYDAALGRFPSTGVGANGMPDVAETTAESGITKLPLTNTDNSGRPDYLDIDADNDGIVDNIEAQPSASYGAPSGLDADSDGLDNTYDLTPGGTVAAGAAVPLTNSDTDTLPDYRDLNSDNDSRLDAVEGWDTDSDGVAEKTASGADVDGDGLDDAFDNDLTRANPTNGETPASFPNLSNPGTAELDWREVFVAPSVTTTISGRIFEDINYSGGAGRDFATANTSAVNGGTGGFANNAILRPGAVAELYDANGVFVAAAPITTATGVYTFTLTNRTSGNYTVRVVNRTVTSVRGGGAGLLSVQTFANGVINKVGGEIPSKIDAPTNPGTQNLLDIINGATTSGPTNTAQSIATIFVPGTATATAPVSNIDFGFNFDVISNTNNAGQGSLRQFIINSNALPNTATTLNQTGLTAGKETSIFMIGDGRTTGTPPAGLRSGVNGGFNTLTQTATITLTTAAASVPLTITDNDTYLDGSRQTVVTGDNVAANGETTTGPEVILDFNNSKGLVVTGANTRIAALGLNNAKNPVGTTTNINVDASGLTLSGSGTGGSVVTGVTTAGNFRSGIRLDATGTATNIVISNNVLSNNVTGTSDGDGLELLGTSGVLVTGNTLNNNKGYGILMTSLANTNNTIANNIIRNNGTGSAAADAGIGMLLGTGNVFSGNTITGNSGDGITAYSAAAGNSNKFTQNTFSGNGELGIDLLSTSPSPTGTVTPAGAGDGVSLNADTKTATSGANGLLNFPAITQVKINNHNLQLTGFAPAGAVVELFMAAADPTGFGEGQTYLFSFTEGGAADADSRTGSYNGLSGMVDNTHSHGAGTGANRFLFTVALSPALEATLTGATLTSTATVGNATSEFSGNIAATTGPLPVALRAFEVAAVKADAQLTWSTATERRNDHFEVERSLDGTSFVKIGQLAGQGSKATPTAYAFLDQGIGAQAGGAGVYYRLRQVDTDGMSAYSPVRVLHFAPAAAPLTAASIGLYPVPAPAETTLDLRALPGARTYSVRLTDLSGRLLGTYTLAGGLKHPLALSGLAAGSYLLSVSGTDAQGAPLQLVKRLTRE